MKTTTTAPVSNMITLANVNQMKFDALRLYGIGNVCADYLERASMVTDLFIYESESVETIVFGFVLSEAERWIEEAQKESNNRYKIK